MRLSFRWACLVFAVVLPSLSPSGEAWAGVALWYRTHAGTGGYDRGEAVGTDASGDIYVAGRTDVVSGGAAFPHFLTLKYDAHGNLLWERPYTKVSGEPAGLAVGSDGSCYVTGASSGEADVLTVKYDPRGNVVWAARYDGGRGEFGQAAVLDGSGNLYVVGGSYPGPLILKYDRQGELLWAHRYWTSEADGRGAARGAAVDAEGNLYVSFDRFNGVDIDFGAMKCSPQGAVIWETSYGSGLNEWPKGIGVDAFGAVYVTGASSAGLGQGSVLTVKFGPDGSLLWSRERESLGPSEGSGLSVSPTGSVYIGGRDPEQLLALEYSSAGDLLWEWISILEYAEGADIALLPGGDLILAGSSYTGSGPWKFITARVSRDGAPPPAPATLPSVSSFPPPGVFQGPLTLVLEAYDEADPAPAIYYTTDATAPTPESRRYTRPFALKAETTLRLIAVTSDGRRSEPVLARYEMNRSPTARAPAVRWKQRADGWAGVTQITARDPDPEDQTFLYAIAVPPKRGMAFVESSGFVSYWPDQGKRSGRSDSFWVSVGDGRGGRTEVRILVPGSR